MQPTNSHRFTDFELILLAKYERIILTNQRIQQVLFSYICDSVAFLLSLRIKIITD
jgi:hypothetical protein